MESKSLTNELIDRFNTLDLLLVSSFIQQQLKIKLEVFKTIFDRFRFKISKRRKKNMTILAVNGFGVEIASNPYFFV